MTEKEIRTLREKIGTDPILTDEEIEYIWMAMDKQDGMKPICYQGISRECPVCGMHVGYLHDYCCTCGQKFDWDDEHD